MNQHNDLFLKGKNQYSKFSISQTGFMKEKIKCFTKDLRLDLSHNFYVMLANEQKKTNYR